jgi:cytochrome c-type biogenesis protein CcmH/NrfG
MVVLWCSLLKAESLAMNSHLRQFFILLFSLLIAVSAAPALAAEPQWIEIRSPHFSVVTDAGEKRGREVAMRFEQMRAVFATLLSNANVNTLIPLQIVAFRNSKELRQYAPLWKGKPIELAGLFQGGEDRTFIMLDVSVENPWTVVFHEYAHQLMNAMMSESTDPWFEEGFAEYFSSIEVDSKEARVGKIPEYYYRVMQQEGMIKIADLFNVRHNSSTYNESGDHRTTFYAESSMVVHYLYDNNLIPKLAPYFTLKIDKGMPVEQAIQQSFGMSSAQFDKVLRNYVSGGRYKYYPIPNPPNIVSKDYAVKPLVSSDSSDILADIHWHSLDYREKAIVEFQEILKTNPNHAGTLRDLGYAYLQKRDLKQAREYFDRSAQADPEDPRVHYYLALVMSGEGSFASPSDLPQITKELEVAIALDPKFADPYMLLAFAQSEAGDPANALVSMQKAVSLNPRKENYHFNLAQLYVQNQKPDQAIAILQVLRNSADLDVAQHASQALLAAQQFQAEQVAPPAANSVVVQAMRGDAGDGSPGIANPPSEDHGTQMQPAQAEAKFLKGTVTSVDCSSPPSAMLTVLAGAKTWKMQVQDSKHLLVMGADGLSCSWRKQKVALNYRDSGDAAGSVISIEVQ